ncbi:MAG: hypothetical protein LBH00_09000 [Planctomycetaceae bacterium]|jgi:hypothetical protein|nr:hypothetical protein [Planctomycetaceae bacterium]
MSEYYHEKSKSGGSVLYNKDKFVISGNTENIRELVRNKDNYRAKVWVINLRQKNEYATPETDVLKIEIKKINSSVVIGE